MIKVKANQAFIHGAYNVNRGDEIEISDSLAADLEKVGLVSRKAAAPVSNKMAPDVQNKSEPAAPEVKPKEKKAK